ncbi:hypothetical protein WMZ97_14285 [Lentibacillus sp. N15]|uniref:hypothetical protein n=1 Tax=Lentibacillus songyuanensis TaxID=3136161 RepID=UPI0031BA90D9
MKKVLLGIVPFIFMFLLTGCFGDSVQDDILNYTNKQMAKAYDLENTALSAYDDVSGANYTDDQTMYTAMVNDVIPNYNEFTKELNNIKVETDELREIHELIIRGADTQYNAFVKIVRALEEQDSGMIEEANGMLDDAKKDLRDYQTQLDKLAKEHDVEWEEK